MAQSNKRVTKESDSTENGEKLKNIYFLSLELENVRCFKKRQKINFSDGKGKPRQWTIILGDNGTGKTTILQTLSANTPEGLSLYLKNFENIYSVSSADIRTTNKHSSNFAEGLSLPVGAIIAGSLLGVPPILAIAALTGYKMGYKLLGNNNKDNKEIDYQIRIFSSLSVGQLLKSPQNGDVISLSSLLKKDSVTNSLKVLEAYNNLFVVAYGASRKAGESSISEENKETAYETLFDEKSFLLNPEEWLLQAHYATTRKSDSQEKRKKELEQVKDILKKVLPDVDDIRFGEKELEGKRIPQPIVEFHTPYGWVEAKDLSLGYRTSMAWVVDFASRMFDTYQESENPLAEPAVCLVDEIDLHLHPRWQREMIDYLSNLFPNTQFIVTTHSPLIVQAGLEHDANIVVCRRNDEKDFVEIEPIHEHLKTLRVDQILSGEYFDVPPRGVKTEKLLDEKELILSKSKLTKADEERLAEIDEKIGFLPVSENQEDNEVMQVLKEAADWAKSKENNFSTL